MAHYLVSGAAGFIGARTTEMLVQEGHSVVGIDNLNDAYDVRMKEHRLARLQRLPGFDFRRLDISIQDELEPLEREQFEAVIHLAARAGVRASVENPGLFFQTNLMGSLHLLELSRRTGITKFVLASTSSIYGANPPYPTPETASSSEPLQPYAASKKAAEVLAHAYHFLHRLDVTVLRYFTVYGPAGRPDGPRSWPASRSPRRTRRCRGRSRTPRRTARSSTGRRCGRQCSSRRSPGTPRT